MRSKHTILALAAVLFSTAAGGAQDAVKIGARIDKLKFTDTRYLPRTLDEFKAKKRLSSYSPTRAVRWRNAICRP